MIVLYWLNTTSKSGRSSSRRSGILTAGPWIDLCLPLGRTTINFSWRANIVKSVLVRMHWDYSSDGISGNCKPLALACNGITPRFNALSQVIQTYSLPVSQTYLRSALNTQVRKSLPHLGIFSWVTWNNTFSVRQTVATCANEIRPTLDIRMKWCINGF